MTGPYTMHGYGDPTPSEALVKDCRTEAQRVTKEILQRGGGKVRRVRVEIDFIDGGEIAHEETGP